MGDSDNFGDGLLTDSTATAAVIDPGDELPPVLLGNSTPPVERRVRSFYDSIADLFERWVARRDSLHTQRAYRQGVMDFVRFMGIDWPGHSKRVLAVRVADVQQYRDSLNARGYAPKTVNHRISAVAAFYRYLREAAIEMRLPISVPNPAHSQFIARQAADPVEETLALSVSQARQLRSLPAGNTLLEIRDRAAISFYLYSGARIGAGCRLHVQDFNWHENDPTIRLNEKGRRRRTVGLHYQAAVCIAEYIEAGSLTVGPLFRPRLNSRSIRLKNGRMSSTTMYDLLQKYLRQLPGALRPVPETATTTYRQSCVFSPHSLRATTATLLLDAGVDICKVQELLGHKHITTTQIYDKRRRRTAQGASHDVPI